MRSEEELTSLFTDYFGDKLSAAQIETLVGDVRTAVQSRRERTSGSVQATAPSGQSAAFWRPQFAH